MDTTRLISSKCPICEQSGDFLELRVPVLDRNGHQMYPARCLACRELSLICPVGEEQAVIVRLDSCPEDLQEMVKDGVRRFGGLLPTDS